MSICSCLGIFCYDKTSCRGQKARSIYAGCADYLAGGNIWRLSPFNFIFCRFYHWAGTKASMGESDNRNCRSGTYTIEHMGDLHAYTRNFIFEKRVICRKAQEGFPANLQLYSIDWWQHMQEVSDGKIIRYSWNRKSSLPMKTGKHSHASNRVSRYKNCFTIQNAIAQGVSFSCYGISHISLWLLYIFLA